MRYYDLGALVDAREGFERVIREYPDSCFARWSFGYVQKARASIEDDLRRRLDAARQLVPATVAYTDPVTFMEVVPRDVLAGSYTVHRVPGELLFRAYAKTPWKKLKTGIPEFPQENLELVVDQTIDPQRWREKVEVAVDVPGRYRIVRDRDKPTMTDVVTFVPIPSVTTGGGSVRIVALNDGAPLAGVSVLVRYRDRSIEGLTDGDGSFSWKRDARAGDTMLIACRRGEEVQAEVRSVSSSTAGNFVFISTDRPIYRPGQRVRYKAVFRERRDGDLALPERREIRVEARDSRDRILFSDTRRWNEHGSISGEFTLDSEPPLGVYRLVVEVEKPADRLSFWIDDENSWRRYWDASFRVEAYRRPELDVSARLESPPELDGAGLRGVIDARYFFGGLVANAEVEWSIWRLESRDDDYDTRIPWPLFDDPRAWFYESLRDDGETGFFGCIVADESPATADDVLLYGEFLDEGRGRTDASGRLEIVVGAPSNRGRRVDYVLRAEVTDLSRLGAEGRAHHTVTSSSVELSTATSKLFYETGETIEAEVRALSPTGQAVGGAMVSFVAFVNADSRFDELESFYSAEVETDARGLSRFHFPAPFGPVVLRASIGERGSKERVEDRVEIVCIDRERPLPLERYDDSLRIEASVQKHFYASEETARVLVRSTSAPIDAYLTISAGGVGSGRRLRLEKPLEIVELPLDASLAPNAFATITAIDGGDVARAGVEIFVYPSGFIDVDVEADRSGSYEPGETMRLRVRTRRGGAPLPAEVELAVVDASVLSLASSTTDDIRLFFHEFNANPDPRLVPASIRPLWEPRSQGGGFFDAGIDVSEEGGDLSEGSTPVRRLFPDTLHWDAHLMTNDDGVAEVELRAPGSLTEWRVIARAVAGADRVGVGTSALLTRKDFLVRLSAPRFFVERDEGSVATLVHNEREIALTVDVELDVDGAELSTGPRRALTVPAGGEARIDWPLRVVSPEGVRLRATAVARAADAADAADAIANDAVEIVVPVNAIGRESRLRFAGRARPEEGWRGSVTLPDTADPKTASLELRVASTRLDVIGQALPHLAGYPYGCVEQTMSRFLPAVIASKASARFDLGSETLRDELPLMVERGLRRLYGFQHEDGGWGWWAHDDTNDAMTAYVVQGLARARAAGFEVEPSALARGARYLAENAASRPDAVYARALAGDTSVKLAEIELPKSVEGRAYLVLAGRSELAGELRIEPPARGTSENIARVALMVEALASVDAGDSRIEPLVDWLLSWRTGRAWASTLDSARAIYALAAVVGEKDVAGPVARVSVNGKPLELRSGRAICSGDALRLGENLVEVECDSAMAYVTATLAYREEGETLLPRSSGGIEVTRGLERRVKRGEGVEWEPLSAGTIVHPGDELNIVVRVTAAEDDVEYVLVESPFFAGAESRIAPDEADELSWMPHFAVRDDRLEAALGRIRASETEEITHRVRVTQPGTYHLLPARAFAMYDPGSEGSSDGFVLRVVEKR